MTRAKAERGAPKAFLDATLAGSAPREPNGCVLWPYSTWYGYAQIYWKPRGRAEAVGRLVLEHFVGPAPSRRHSMGHAPHAVCGNRHCIAPEHLSWQTSAEQAASRAADGTGPEIYSDDEVLGALRRLEAGESQADVARSIGVSDATVYYWRTGQVRGHLVASLKKERQP